MGTLHDLTRDGARLLAYAAPAWPTGIARCPGCGRRVAVYTRRDGTPALRLHNTLPSVVVDGVLRLRGERCAWSMREPVAPRAGRRPPGTEREAA